jgi:hypothetical protein
MASILGGLAGAASGLGGTSGLAGAASALGGTSGLAGAASGLAGAAGLDGAAAAAAAAALGVQTPPPPYIKGTFKWPLAKWMHILLTGILPFLPFIPYVGPAFFSLFSTWGSNGANLLLTNSMGWALAKAGFNYACRGAYMLVAMGYPGQWWLPYLKGVLYYANPWYVFDMVQGQSETFAEEGYKMPFADIYLNETLQDRQKIIVWNRAERVKIRKGLTPDPLYPKCFAKRLTQDDIGFNEPVTDLSGNVKVDISGNTVFALDASGNPITCYGFMTNMKLGMMLLFIWPWLVEMSSLFPPVVQALFDPWVTWGLSLVAGLTALSGTIATTSFITAPNAIPDAISKLSGLMPKMNGGGKKQSGGIKFPHLNDVIHNVLDNTKEVNDAQTGGSSNETDESIVFLGSLAIVSLAGISLALIRSKNLSGKSV